MTGNLINFYVEGEEKFEDLLVIDQGQWSLLWNVLRPVYEYVKKENKTQRNSRWDQLLSQTEETIQRIPTVERYHGGQQHCRGELSGTLPV